MVVAAIALIATVIGRQLPVLGAPVAGIVLGVLATRPLLSTTPLSTALRPGVKFASGTVLQLSVVLLGARLSLREVGHVGVSTLPVMLGTLAVCLAAAYFLGRALGIDSELRILVGSGTAICGAAAIAAVSPVIRARNTSVAYAISTIFVFNVAAVLLFPPLGHLLGMSQEAFGLFAGTAVNDTSSVVAAATTFGDQATDHAVVVKLVRSLMIIPIVMFLGAMMARRSRDVRKRTSVFRLVPSFLVGFVLVVAVNTIGLIPAAAQPTISGTSVFLITMALVAIGMSVDVKGLRQAGIRPVLFGAALWVLVSVTSLLLQWVTM